MSGKIKVKEYDWGTSAFNLAGSIDEIIKHLQDKKEKYGEDCGYEGKGEYEDWDFYFG